MSENFKFSILTSQVKIEFDSQQKLQNRFMTTRILVLKMILQNEYDSRFHSP